MRQFILLFAFLHLIVSAVLADDLDDFIRQQLRKRQVPGLSIAIIQNGKIVKASGYGFIDNKGKIPVTTSTLFQAGSISKSVAAVGALKLVEDGKLSLDENVNSRLRTWKVPENEFTQEKKVTLRGILSHTTGLTVHGFPGYEVGKPVPTLGQILDGVSPANTPAVRVDFVPGTRWRYSGGGYTVMQQLMLDVTGQSFPDYTQKFVLSPLGMRHSTYQQPLPAEKAKTTATGYYGDRSEVKGRWHLYPEMAAAGLWTTPSDLARFAMSIQQSFAGKTGGVLSQAMTQQMLTNQKDNDGLGVFLQGKGRTRRFGHNGRDEGFDAALIAGVETGQGVVIMINVNDNSRMIGQIINEVARTYHWADFSEEVSVKPKAVQMPSEQLTAYEGRYELANNRIITFISTGTRLVTLADGLPDEEFVPINSMHFASTDRDIVLAFHPDGKGKITGLDWKQGKEERTIPRIGPLFHSLKRIPDPDPARSRKIATTLKAMAQGGKAVEETPDVTAGVRNDFRDGDPKLSNLENLTFVNSEDVAGRGLERHQSLVSQVVHYTFGGENKDRYLLVYLTADGLITDYDRVEK